jgi:hypothetical protein
MKHMKKSILLAALMSTLVIVPAEHAAATNRAGAWTLTVGSAYDFFADKRNMHDAWMLPTIQLGYDIDQNWAIEGGYGTFQTTQSAIGGGHNVSGDLYTVDGLYRLTNMGTTHIMYPIEPYISAGVGVYHINPNGFNAQNLGNINAGLGAQMFFGDSVALRGEARDIYTWAGSKNDVTLGFGVSFLFGGNTPKAEPTFKGEDFKA